LQRNKKRKQKVYYLIIINNLNKEKEKMKKKYDLVIIGSGPGGLTAGIYAARYNMNFIVIGEIPGGMIAEAHKVCNYPSQNNISGFELTQKMVEHLKELEGEIIQEKVLEVKKEKNGFKVKTKNDEYTAKKVIIGTGRVKGELGVKGEKEFKGKGVSYCATCDGPFYRDKIVGVVGGGNSAITAALLLSEHSKQVYVIHRGDGFPKAEPAWLEQMQEDKKIKTIFKSEVEEIYGKDFIEGVKLSTGKDLKLDGIFIEIGSFPQPKCLGNLKIKRDGKYIAVDEKQKTSVPNLLAVGDITNNVLKQAITAAAEGAVAATTAYKELRLERKHK
jgi:thioredoxin reductase (NADPH)